LVRPREVRMIPVSVKTRLGYERNIIDQWLPVLLEEKPAVISLHGRTLQQGYKGDADWNAIARAVEIAGGSETLIIGNGDAQDLADACRRVRATGVDGVLLGRAAQGNPWVFAGKDRVKTAANQATELRAVPPNLAQRFAVIAEHCGHYEKLMANRNFVAMRKHLTWYCRNFRGAAELRAQMIRVNSANEAAECLARFSRRTDADGQAATITSPPQSEQTANL
jgi:tRNA-dihydrouridine synthase